MAIASFTCAMGPSCHRNWTRNGATLMTEDLRTPILPGTAASDYERYLRTDELLALQKPAEQMLHKDELTFQVVHQASELLMKGAAWELERAVAHLQEGDFGKCARLIRRAN